MTHTFSGFQQSELRSLEQLPDLALGKIWRGDSNGRPVETAIDLDSLPSLTQNKMWVGDSNNRPIESNLLFAPFDATFVLKQSNSSLPNAIVMDNIAANSLLKVEADGNIVAAIAGIVDEDYVKPSAFSTLSTSVAFLDTLVTGLDATVNAVNTGLVTVVAGHTVVLAGLAIWQGITTNDVSILKSTSADVHVAINALKAATYIVKSASSGLDNEQALDALAPGLLKHTGGVIATASPDTDYVDPETAMFYALIL